MSLCGWGSPGLMRLLANRCNSVHTRDRKLPLCAPNHLSILSPPSTVLNPTELVVGGPPNPDIRCL